MFDVAGVVGVGRRSIGNSASNCLVGFGKWRFGLAHGTRTSTLGVFSSESGLLGGKLEGAVTGVPSDVVVALQQGRQEGGTVIVSLRTLLRCCAGSNGYGSR